MLPRVSWLGWTNIGSHHPFLPPSMGGLPITGHRGPHGGLHRRSDGGTHGLPMEPRGTSAEWSPFW